MMPELMDLKIDPTTHDLMVNNYDLSLVSGIDRVRQDLSIRLWFFYNEWPLDTSKGLPWYAVLGGKYDAGKIEAVVKETILDTADVTKIVEYSQVFSDSARKLLIVFSVDTTFGTTTLTLGN